MQKCLVQLELDVDLGGHLVGEQAAVVVGDDDLADLEGGGGREGEEEEEDGEGEGGRHCGRMFFHKYRVGVGMCVQESELCSTVPHSVMFGLSVLLVNGVKYARTWAEPLRPPDRERNFRHLSDSPEAMKWYLNAQRNSYIQRPRKIEEGKCSPEFFFQTCRQLMANLFTFSTTMHFAKTNSTGAQQVAFYNLTTLTTGLQKIIYEKLGIF